MSKGCLLRISLEEPKDESSDGLKPVFDMMSDESDHIQSHITSVDRTLLKKVKKKVPKSAEKKRRGRGKDKKKRKRRVSRKSATSLKSKNKVSKKTRKVNVEKLKERLVKKYKKVVEETKHNFSPFYEMVCDKPSEKEKANILVKGYINFKEYQRLRRNYVPRNDKIFYNRIFFRRPCNYTYKALVAICDRHRAFLERVKNDKVNYINYNYALKRYRGK